ncbi:methionine-R-sulfoxide reductase B1 isoform X2 [Mus caroli]|uniref:Methionine-R-sulfoxide reductase B1 n=1 Tax=Mus caroli TaxID=10089 RepID=A0A6P5NVC0_MUSCR|nr:methionine-R-sulfoxide reductase B1 isoform X2 [Mus caroli]
MSFCSFFGGEVFQNHFEPGVYVCAKCSYELFSSRSKYAHSSPWPAFTETIHADSVTKCPEKNRPEALKGRLLLNSEIHLALPPECWDLRHESPPQRL